MTISTRYKYEGCIDYSPCLQYAAEETLCCNKKRFDADEDEVIREAPGRRVYSKIKDLQRVYNGLGISILSTPRGVLSDSEARDMNVGGEILCQVF